MRIYKTNCDVIKDRRRLTTTNWSIDQLKRWHNRPMNRRTEWEEDTGQKSRWNNILRKYDWNLFAREFFSESSLSSVNRWLLYKVASAEIIPQTTRADRKCDAAATSDVPIRRLIADSDEMEKKLIWFLQRRSLLMRSKADRATPPPRWLLRPRNIEHSLCDWTYIVYCGPINPSSFLFWL